MNEVKGWLDHLDRPDAFHFTHILTEVEFDNFEEVKMEVQDSDSIIDEFKHLSDLKLFLNELLTCELAIAEGLSGVLKGKWVHHLVFG